MKNIESLVTLYDGHTHWFGENFVRQLLLRIEMLKQELVTANARIHMLDVESVVNAQKLEEMRIAHNKAVLELTRLTNLLEGGGK